MHKNTIQFCYTKSDSNYKLCNIVCVNTSLLYMWLSMHVPLCVCVYTTTFCTVIQLVHAQLNVASKQKPIIAMISNNNNYYHSVTLCT